MRCLAVLFGVVLLCSSLCSALQCYHCQGCSEGQRGNPVQCSSSQTKCLKAVLGSRVEKSCSNNAACHLSNFEKGLHDIYSDLSSTITGNERDSSDSTRMIHCCETDYCNSQPPSVTATSLLMLLFPTVILTYMLH